MIEYTISYCIYIGADYDSVTLGSCNPMFRILVTCGYPGERGYFVSKKAFLSIKRGYELVFYENVFALILKIPRRY